MLSIFELTCFLPKKVIPPNSDFLLKETSSSRQLGLITVISLVAGGMIGSGIFTLPAVLTNFGTISLVGWIVGAYSLANMMGPLSKVIPESGGSYAYTKTTFGELPAFIVAWGFWLPLWSTNAAIALAFTGYLSIFIPALKDSIFLFASVLLSVIWGLTVLNAFSIRSSGNLQVVTTALIIIPVLVVAVGGIFFFDPEHFTPLNLARSSDFQAITSASVLCFFAFMGIEAAIIPADNNKDPEKNHFQRDTYRRIAGSISLSVKKYFIIWGIISG